MERIRISATDWWRRVFEVRGRLSAFPVFFYPLHDSVYRAVNFEDHRVAACKLVLLTPSTSEKERKTIEKEMRVHAALKHTNVLEFLNAVVVEPKHRDIYVPGIYMLLELAAGGDLFDKIGECDIEVWVRSWI